MDIFIYDCEGSFLYGDTVFGAGPNTLNYTVTTTGVFTVVMSAAIFGLAAPFNFNGNVVLSSDGAFLANPVIALWDDSGTTRQLEACPKMLLPPLTEDTGDWYADCAEAATAITDMTSNCVGYCDTIGEYFSFVASGGSSLGFTRVATENPSAPPGSSPPPNTGYMWGGLNAVAGETLTLSGTGCTDGTMDIYDDAGVLVETLSGALNLVSSALPYTGRYTVRVSVSQSPPPTSSDWPYTFTASVTSSGTMSVNEIAAAWDSGLTCPSYLNCGDSC
jgi:hypothetical protein